MKPSSSMDKPRAKRGYFIINDKKIPVYDGINIIGRNKEATVIIKDSNVSHQHAILVITEKDHYLSDIKSINGTFMENTKLIPFQLYSISDKAFVKFSSVKATYFYIQDGEVILENTQSQMVDDTIYCSKTQLFNSDVLINVQSELVNQPEQVVSLSSQNYYVADDIDLAGVEVTTLSIHELPTQKVDDMYESSEILNAQQTRVFVNGMPTKLDEVSCNNDKSKIVSIHELPTQKLDDSINNVPQRNETKSTDEAFQFCINDAPTQIVNLNDRSGYEIENVKSNNESVSDSLNVIDETIMDDSIINKNEKLADPEIADENTRDSIDFITMKPASQYFVDSADTDSQSFLHTSQLTKKKSSVIKSDDEYSEQNEEKSNKRILTENDSSSDETDVEDTIKEKKYYTNSEFEVHFNKLSKRKRNIITSDEEDSNEVANKIGKKDIDSKLSMHVSEALKKKRNIIMSDEEDNDEINRTSSIENKSKSTESSDDTDVEIDTKHTKKIDVPEMEDNKQQRVESSLEETDIESGCNLNGISRTKKKYLKKHRSNKNSNGDMFKNVVIDNVQDVSESETDLETVNDNAKTAETIGGKTEFDLSGKLNDTDLIPPTQNCFEGEIDFEFNTQDLMSKSNEFKNSNNNDLQIDSNNKVKIDTVEQTDASAIHDDMKKLDANKNVHKNELNLTNKFNDSDVIQATPNCFEGDINFDFNTQDLYSKTNKCENSIESTIPNQNDNSICNSEQVLSESFHLALSCSIDMTTETDIIDKLSVGSSEKVTITKDSDAIFLQPTQILPPFDCSVQPKTQDLHTTKKCFDTMGKTINKAGDKNSDKCKIKTTDNESSIFLKPQKENVSILDDNDDIFLQPTQQLLPEKTSEQFDTQLHSRIPKSDVFLHPTQKMTQSDNVLALDDDDDIFLQPTQQISLSERKSEKFDAHLPSIISRSDVSLRPTQKLIQKNNVLAHVDDDDDDDDNIFLQPTQQFSLPEKTSERFDAQLPLKVPESDVFLCPTQKMTQRNNMLSHDDDDLYLQPTQQLSLCGRSSERLQSKVSKSNVFKCTPKISQKENVVAQDDEDDIFLQCTQQLTLPETRYEKAQLSENSTENKLKEKVQPKSIKADITFDNNTDDLFLQPTQLLPVCKEAQEEEISFQACKKRSKFTENLTENKIKMDVKVDQCQSVTEKNIHDNIFQQQTQTETEEDPFLGPTQKIHIECAKGGNENKHTFLVPTRDSVSVNQTQSVEEKLADIFRPTQPDAAELPTAIEANDSLFLEATQIIDEKYVSITPITSKVEEKTDHVESQLEVMFASQNVKLTDIDDLRPPNPLVNVFNDVIAGSIGSQDVEVVPSAFNSINNQNDAKIKPTEKSKKKNAALSNENDEDAGSIKSFEKTKKGKTTRKTRSGKTSCDEIKEQLMNNDLKQYAGAKLRRSRRNSTKDVNINMSVINNNDKGLDNITESENLHGKISSKSAQSKEVEINKTSKDIGIKISMKHLPEVDNAPDSPNTGSAKDVNIKKPTKNINITVTEGNVNIEGNNTNDKPLKILPQNETTRTRAKRKFTETETPSKGSKVEQSADKLTIKLNHLITNPVTNTPTIETLPSSLTDLNPAESSKMVRRTRKASTTSEDDFFVKAPKRTKGRVIESDNDKSCGVALTTPVKSKKLQATVDTPERYKRTQKPKVVFTMLDSPELESVIRSLGGSVVDTVDACTVLLTGCIKRSQKLLTAVGQGKPICSPKWLHESKNLGKFIDPWDYILEDDEAEQRWNFSLRESLNRSSNKKLLENYTCLLVVFSAQDVLKGAIEACGGKCVSRAPPKNSTATLVVVANPENKQKYSRFLKQNPRPLIVASEAIFDGVLRQELNFENHILT